MDDPKDDWLSEYEGAVGTEEPKDWLDEYDAARPVGFVEGAQQVGHSVLQGLAGIPAGVVQTTGIAAGLAGADDFAAGAQAFAQQIRDVAAKAIPEVERLRDSFWLSKGPEALGSGLGFAIPGLALLKAAGVPAWASTMSLGAAVQSAAQYEDARMSGASEDDQTKAWLLGMGLGLTEAVPIARIINRADKASGGALKHALIDGVIEGGEEFIQEAGTQTASNAIAAHLLQYDEDRSVWQGVLEAGLGGAFAGVMMSGLATAVAHAKAPGKPQEPGAPAEGQTGVEPTHDAPAGRGVADIGPETAPGAPGTELTPELKEKITRALGRRLEPEALAEAQAGMDEMLAKAAEPHVQGAVRSSKKIEDPEVEADRRDAEAEAAAQEEATVEAFGRHGARAPAQAARLEALVDELLLPAAAEFGADSDELEQAREVVSKATDPRGAAIDVVGAWRAGVPAADLAKTPTRAAAPRPRPKPAPTTAPASAKAPQSAQAAPRAAAAAQSTAAPTEPTEAPDEPAERPPVVPQAVEGVSIKNAALAAELEAMGLPPAERGEVVPNLDRYERAMETMRRAPDAGARLVTRLEKSGKAHTADEGALLALEVNRLMNARDAAQDEFNADPSEENKAVVKKTFEDFMRAADVAMRSGSEAGSALQIRRMINARDYSLASMERSFAEAGGGKLTDAERTWIATMSAKLTVQKKAADEADRAAKDARKAAAPKSPRAERREQRAEEIAAHKAELARLLEELGVKGSTTTGMGGGADASYFRTLAKIAAEVIQIGGTTLAQWADQMVAQFGERARPHLDEAWASGQALSQSREDFEQGSNPMPVPADAAQKVARKRKREPGVGEPKNARTAFKLQNGKTYVVGWTNVLDWWRNIEAAGLTPSEAERARYWYENARNFFKETGPAWPNYVMGWLVANQHVTVAGATLNAFRGREHALAPSVGPKAGLTEGAMLQFWNFVEKGEGSLEGLEIGQKLYDFIDSALLRPTRQWMGNDSRAGSPFVVDVQSLRDMGYIDKGLQNWLRENVVPSQLAAVEALKVDSSGAPTETQYERAAERGARVAAWMNKSKKLGDNWESWQVQAVGWIAMQKRLGQELGTPDRTIPYVTRTIPMEAMPGAGAPRAAELEAFGPLSREENEQLTKAVIATALEEALPLVGSPPILSETHARGGWFDDLTPGNTIRIGASPEAGQSAGKMLAYALEQTEVGTGTLLAMTKGGNVPSGANGWFLDVTGPDLQTEAGREAMWKAMRQHISEIAVGFTVTPQGMRIFVSTRGQYAIGKYQGTTGRDRLRGDVLAKAGVLQSAVPGKVAFEAAPGRFDRSNNNWTEKPDGRDHLEGLDSKYGPEVLGKLHRAREAVGRVFTRELQRIAEARGAAVSEGGLLRVSGGARANASLGPGSSSGLRRELVGSREELAEVLNGSGPARKLAPGTALVALGEHRERVIPKGFDVRGKKLVDLADLGGIILDSPLIERFQLVLAREGKVLAHAIWAAGTPTACFVPLKETRATIAKMFPEMLPSDVLWALHNHPAGTAMPSQADTAVAARLNKESGAAHVRHAFIANGTVVEFSDAGTVASEIVAPKEDRGISHSSYLNMSPPRAAKAIMGRFEPPLAGAVVVFTDSAERVRAAWSVPENLWSEDAHVELAVALRERMLHYGAARAFAYEGAEARIPWGRGDLTDRMRVGWPVTAMQLGEPVERVWGTQGRQLLGKAGPTKPALLMQAKRELAAVIDKLGASTSAGMLVDPALVLQLARASFAVGYRQFDVWASEMVAKVGKHIEPYLREAWDKAKEERAQKSRIQARKAFLRRRTAEMRDRMARNDFSPKAKPALLALDKEATRLQADYEETRREFERAKEKKRLAERTRVERSLDAGKEVINLPKAVWSAYDLSGLLRQGGFYTLGHPFEAATVHAPRMMRAVRSERAALEIDVEIRRHPLAETALAGKLELTRHGDDPGPHEEAIRSALSDKIPGLKASNRAYITLLNSVRMAMFAEMYWGYAEKPTAAQVREIARFVNIATGRGDPGKLAGALEAASIPIWAPRLLLSRFQLLAAPARALVKNDAATRKVLAKQYARTIAGLGAVYLLASLFRDDDDERAPDMFEWDPRSSDFGKIRIGNTRIDPLFGLAQVTTLLGRLGLGGTKNTETDKVTPIWRDVPYGQPTAGAVLGKFLRTKISPTLGIPWDLRAGENMVGEEFTPTLVAQSMGETLRAPLELASGDAPDLDLISKNPLVPLSFRDIYDAMKEHGVPAGTALGLLSIFGAGLQTYEPRKKKRKAKD